MQEALLEWEKEVAEMHSAYFQISTTGYGGRRRSHIKLWQLQGLMRMHSTCSSCKTPSKYPQRYSIATYSSHSGIRDTCSWSGGIWMYIFPADFHNGVFISKLVWRLHTTPWLCMTTKPVFHSKIALQSWASQISVSELSVVCAKGEGSPFHFCCSFGENWKVKWKEKSCGNQDIVWKTYKWEESVTFNNAKISKFDPPNKMGFLDLLKC